VRRILSGRAHADLPARSIDELDREKNTLLFKIDTINSQIEEHVSAEAGRRLLSCDALAWSYPHHPAAGMLCGCRHPADGR
jgi:hypothetical protein